MTSPVLVETGSLASRLRALASDPVALETVVWRLLCSFVLTIPISIALSETVLTVTIVLAALCWRLRADRARLRTPLDAAALCFVATALLAAFVGLNVRQSLWGLRTYFHILIANLVFAHARDEERTSTLIALFLAAMALTSSLTVFNALSPWQIPRVFPGHMTQSGQLLFAIGIAGALTLYRPPRLPGSRALPFALALYIVAVLANLKRGVWLGVFATAAVIGLLQSRRLILATLALIGAVTLFLPQVQTRIGDTARDLFLPGARYDIWRASVDVIRRFPMGVGRKNGTILRDYPNIPQNHKHAHNNFLQITLEDGLLGLAAFTWWMGAFGSLCWRTWRGARRSPPLFRAISVAAFATFVGFHVAGLVEYNFGDTEVLQIFFVMMGLALVVHRS